MGEAYFDAIHETTPSAFENGEIIMEGWVMNEFIDEMGGGHMRGWVSVERCAITRRSYRIGTTMR